MTSSSRIAAQQRADDIRVFRAELTLLESEGVVHLDADQKDAIAKHHEALLAGFVRNFDIDSDPSGKQLSLGMRIASFLGAIALAASIFFLFYQFWGRFSSVAQVALLGSFALGSFVLTLVVDRRDATGYFTKLAAMVAFACFVLNITMLGQSFNITPSDKALLPWAAYALVLAYTFELRLLLAAGIMCLIAFVAARVGAWGGMYWIHFGERPENFFLPAAAIFLMPQAFDMSRFPGFAALHRIFGLLALFLPMLVLAHWGSISYLPVDRDLIQGTYQTLGFVGTAALVWVGAKRHWQEVINTSVILFVIFFFTKLFDWWWDAMPKYLFFLLMGLIAILMLLILERWRMVNL
jgi:uncharacterized membrane protein